jgi:hypothetical protein
MPLTSCQRSMTVGRRRRKFKKLLTSPFLMRVIAMNIAPATLPACISRSPCLARQAQFCNRTLSLLKRLCDEFGTELLVAW